MKLTSLASGSDGNCIYIASEKRNILIDAGISLKKIEEGLEDTGLKVSDLDAIFITHEHADHIAGLGVLLRKYDVPVYLTEGTYNTIKEKNMIGNVPDEMFNIILPDKQIKIGDIKAEAFSVSHDAAQPVMYKLLQGDKQFAIVTDLGSFDDGLVERLSGLDGALIEANHDVRMLEVGPYPYALKKRILGDKGHLSNEMAAELIKKIYSDSLKNVIIGHISKRNNYEELAYETVRMETTFAGCDFNLNVASHQKLSETIEI